MISTPVVTTSDNMSNQTFYYIYQVAGQLKSVPLETHLTFDEMLDSLSSDCYGLREVTQEEYEDEVDYNHSKRNPWNR